MRVISNKIYPNNSVLNGFHQFVKEEPYASRVGRFYLYKLLRDLGNFWEYFIKKISTQSGRTWGVYSNHGLIPSFCST